MTIPGFAPPPGTPLGGLRGVARMAVSASERADAALHPDTGSGMHSVGGTSGTTLSLDAQTMLACFRIATCWRREKRSGTPGATKGFSWVCDGVPVRYWWDYRHEEALTSSGSSGTPRTIFPGSFWEVLNNEPIFGGPSGSSSQPPSSSSGAVRARMYTQLWWGVRGPQAVDGSSASMPSSGGVCTPLPGDDWQDVLYPEAGVGSWVWCVLDHAAGVWRVIAVYDALVRFELTEPLTGCGHASARAELQLRRRHQ